MRCRRAITTHPAKRLALKDHAPRAQTKPVPPYGPFMHQKAAGDSTLCTHRNCEQQPTPLVGLRCSDVPTHQRT